MTKIGLLFGSFDPPHLGHMHLAKSIKVRQGLDEVWFILQLHNPHKPHISAVSDQQRIEMLRLALEGNEYYSLHISRAASLPVAIAGLKQAKPSAQFSLIMGKDLADSFASWKDYQKLAHLPVYTSGRYSGISSEQVRALIKQGEFPADALAPAVAHYIKQRHLYK